MREEDVRELEWWREVFACRFQDDNLPKVGTPLLGHHFQIQVEDSMGEWTTWTNRGVNNARLRDA